MKRILFIEPNTVLADVYGRFFRDLNYDVSHATTAQSAIHAADTNRPDLVVLELQLVEHNGVAFLHEFRSYAEWQGVPVIINTVVAPNRLAVVEQPLRRDMGVVACFYKPQTSLQQLRQGVEQQLGAV